MLSPGYSQDFTHAEFKVGVLVTHWNGIPIDRAVELNAEREAGSNEDARHARGLEALTLRPMALTAPPDEEWVVVGYEVNGQSREQRFDWKVFEPPPSPTGIDPTAFGAEIATVLGVDAVTEAVRGLRRHCSTRKAYRPNSRWPQWLPRLACKLHYRQASRAVEAGPSRTHSRCSGSILRPR